MKINTGQEKAKRIPYGNSQKAPIFSMSPRNDNTHKIFIQNTMRRQETLEHIEGGKVRRGKYAQDQGFTNIFAEDIQSTKYPSKRENRVSPENLRVSFKGKQLPNKIVRQSQNIHSSDNLKTPPNSLCDRVLSITKSVSNLGKTNDELLYIKSDKQTVKTQKDQEQQEWQELHELVKKIQEVKAFNDKMEEENIHLRLEKLHFSSEYRELLALRKDINEVRKKIEKLRGEAVRVSDNYEDYYSTKKDHYTQKKPIAQVSPVIQKPKLEFLPKTQSNLQGQHFSSIMGQYDTSRIAYEPLSPTLTRSRVEQKNRPKKLAQPGYEDKFQGPSYRIQDDKNPNIVRLQIKKL